MTLPKDIILAPRNACRRVGQKIFFKQIVKNIDQTGTLSDTTKIFNKGARGYFGIISPIQSRQELVPVLDILKKEAPKTIMEIGTARGGTLFMLTRVADPHAKIISLDLPGGDFGGGYGKKRIPLYQAFALEGQSMHLVRDDSHKPATMQSVREILGGGPLDFILIDGDHTYEGVKLDYEMYAPLVRPGGLIAFHDIRFAPGVARFWGEIKDNFDEATEFVAPHEPIFGIGLGRKAASPAP